MAIGLTLALAVVALPVALDATVAVAGAVVAEAVVAPVVGATVDVVVGGGFVGDDERPPRLHALKVSASKSPRKLGRSRMRIEDMGDCSFGGGSPFNR
ncbi:MAG: hypothetical protein ABI369_09155 [Acetobacteraceae bacterium]